MSRRTVFVVTLWRAKEFKLIELWQLFRTAVQGIAIFFLVQTAMRWLMPQAQNDQAAGGSSNAPSTIPSFAERPLAASPDVKYNQVPQAIAPIWPDNIPLDITIYVS